MRQDGLLTANCVFMLLSPPYLLLSDPRPSAEWESPSKVGLCDAGGGVTKTGPIIGNFLTFWWFCLLITAGYWLQTIWETFFHIENSILYFDNYCFPEKASMLWRLTKINHFLLSLVVAWSGSSQIWSLFEHDESWCSGSVSIIRTLQSTLWTHSIHTSSSCILRRLIFSFWKWFFNSNAIVKFFCI